jgi:hypothetical protein
MAEAIAVIGLSVYYDVLDQKVTNETAGWAEQLAAKLRSMYPRLVTGPATDDTTSKAS